MDMNMKESMMRNQVSVYILMNKLLIIPMFFLTMCGTAPVTPPAGACSLPLDGSPANCPDTLDDIKLPREELRGEVDIYDPMHWHSINQMFIRNARRTKMEKNMTQPEDAINKALAEFNNGGNDTTKSEELLQLPSNGDKPSS
jgi:hypothetical protein